MKQFFKTVLASMVGFFLAFLLCVFLIMVLVSGVLSGFEKNKKEEITSHTLLEIKLDEPVTERTQDDPFGNFSFSDFGKRSQPGLNDIIASIQAAAKDDKIDGIILEVDQVSAGMASLQEIRNELLDFKKSGKAILAYSEYMTQSAYLLASVADTIYLNPQGGIEFRGLRTELMFFKGAFEKLGVEPQVIKHGKFKSAAETFVETKMTDENRVQISRFVDSMYDDYLSSISGNRKIEKSRLKELADGLMIKNAKDAVKYGLVDKLIYRDEFMSIQKKLSSVDEKDKLKTISLAKYNDSKPTDYSKNRDQKIAVIYANGNIVSGDGDDNSVGSERISEAIRKARNDDKVKAIVLRVNSPGGSALASDVILREAELAVKVKPFVVSMGNLAASGGYYISCKATKIVAQPNTITGSIGVIGLILSGKELLNQKLGITVDTYKTGPYADMGTFTRPLTANEKEIIANSVDEVYETFVEHVSVGRGMTRAKVDSIGQGRVWTGRDALALGLVDTLGSLQDAIHIAAKEAGLTDYKVVEQPELLDPITKMMRNMSESKTESVIRKELGASYPYYMHLKDALRSSGIQTRMPVIIDIY